MSPSPELQLVAMGLADCASLLIKLTVLLGAVFAIQFLAKRRSAAFRHAVLSSGLLVAPGLIGVHFLAPSWSIPCPTFLSSRSVVEPLVIAHPNETERLGAPLSDSMSIDLSVGNPFETDANLPLVSSSGRETVESGVMVAGKSSVGPPLASGIRWLLSRYLAPVVVSVWLLGVILLLSRLVFAWSSVSRAIAQSRSLAPGTDLVSLPASVRQMLNEIARRGIQIKISPSEIQSPLGMGVFKRTILLPASCWGWTPSQWRSVALHEQAHFVRHDCLVNLIARIHQALFWFHPFSWLLVSRLGEECEKACDDCVIRSGVSRLEYADVLLHVARTTASNHVSPLATMTMCDGTPLESRIQSVLSSKTIRHPVRMISCLTIIVSLAAIAIPVSTAQLVVEPTRIGVMVADSDAVNTVEVKTRASLDGDVEESGLNWRGSADGPISPTNVPAERDGSIRNELAGLAAGQISDRVASNSMTYHIRAPKNYDPAKATPAIVILHDASSNSTTYIENIVETWPEIADRYLLIGIDGEFEMSNGSTDSPRYNYSFVNFAGKSKYGGFPGTDRESPALVAEVLEEVRSELPISTLFLGGHGQGGWLAYSVYMNYAELMDGAFPMGAAVIIQCEPTAYTDQLVRTLQRETPIAIIHAKNDHQLEHSFSLRAYREFLDHSFPMVRLFDDELEGHAFTQQDLPRAITWLETMSVRDPQDIVDAAIRLVQQGHFRDASGLLLHLDVELLASDDRSRLKIATGLIQSESEQAATQFGRMIDANEDGKWIDDFLEYRKQFEFSPAASEAMEKFNELRAEHDLLTSHHFAEARAFVDAGDPEKANDLYQEIVDKFYASTLYLDAKQILDNRRVPN